MGCVGSGGHQKPFKNPRGGGHFRSIRAGDDQFLDVRSGISQGGDFDFISALRRASALITGVAELVALQR